MAVLVVFIKHDSEELALLLCEITKFFLAKVLVICFAHSVATSQELRKTHNSIRRQTSVHCYLECLRDFKTPRGKADFLPSSPACCPDEENVS